MLGPIGPAGPQGNIGPDKVIRTQVVTDSGTITSEQGQVTATAVCPSDTTLSGGGFYIEMRASIHQSMQFLRTGPCQELQPQHGRPQ